MVKESKCADVIFQFQGINNNILLPLFCDYAVTNKYRIKCFDCKKQTQPGTSIAYCCECGYYFHLKCEKVNQKDTPLPPDWVRLGCVMKALPFGGISDENIKLINHGFSDENIDFVLDKCPSFTIKVY